MRKLIITLSFAVSSILLLGQNENPFSQFGYEAPILNEKKHLIKKDDINLFYIINTDTSSDIGWLTIDVSNKQVYYFSKESKLISSDTLLNYNLARWLTPDPMKQYHSPYLGMGNNPISRIDPDGSFADDIHLNTSTGEIQVVETNNPDRIFVDGVLKWEHAIDGYWKNFLSMKDVTYFKNYQGFYNHNFAEIQRSLVGKPYLRGTDGPDKVDCSGAICYGILKLTGTDFRTTHTANKLYDEYSSNGGNKAAGTVVFYDYTNDGYIDHVTTILDPNHMVHPSSGSGKVLNVSQTYLDNYTSKQGGKIYYRQLNWPTTFTSK